MQPACAWLSASGDLSLRFALDDAELRASCGRASCMRMRLVTSCSLPAARCTTAASFPPPSPPLTQGRPNPPSFATPPHIDCQLPHCHGTRRAKVGKQCKSCNPPPVQYIIIRVLLSFQPVHPCARGHSILGLSALRTASARTPYMCSPPAQRTLALANATATCSSH